MPVVSTRRSRTLRALALGIAALIASALFATGVGAGAASATAPMSLTIHLTSATGSVVPDAEVDVYQLENGTISDDEYYSDYSTAYPVEKKAGTYLDNELNGPGEYVIELSGDSGKGTAEQWLGGSLTQDGAKVLTLTAGANTISASYAPSGTISGKVTNTAGKALRDICVTVDVFDGTNWTPQDDYDCAGYTNSSGKYSFSPGAAGSYKVEFTDTDTGKYLSQFANGAADDADAAPLYLPAGKSAVVNTSLTLGGTLRGTLLETQVPSTPAELYLIPYLLSGPTGAPTSATPAIGSGFGEGDVTNSHGAFSISGLSAGNYALGYFDLSEYEEGGFSGMPAVHFLGDNGAGVLHATSFPVTAAHTTVVPTTAVGSPTTATGSLVVTLEDSDGKPIPNESQEIQVISDDSFIPYSVSGDTSAGEYHFDSLPTGGYDVYVEIVGDDGDVYQPQSVHVNVGAGETDQAIQMQPLTTFAFTTPPSTDSVGGVGSDVVADPGVVNLTGDDSTVSYQWYDVDADGNRTLIRGAQSQHFTPRSADFGQQIEARVTQTYNIDVAGAPMYQESVSAFTNLDSISESSSIVNVSAPRIANPAAVRVGAEADAIAGKWMPSGSSYTYAWYRDDSDIPIDGATHASYTPVPDDQGHQLSVRVTPSRVGYGTPQAVASAQVLVGSGDAATIRKAPVVTKKTRAGVATFTATTGTWSVPSADLQFHYSWSVGTTVYDHDLPTFTPDTPGVVAVTVTATRPGYANGTASVIAAKGTLPLITAEADLVGSGNVVTASTLEPVGQLVEYAFDDSATLPDGSAIHPAVQWQRQTKSKWSNIPHQNGDGYSFTVADIGHHVRARLTIATGQWATEVVYANAGIGGPGDFLTGVGSVSTPLMRTFGGSLTATVSGFLPGVKHTYQWRRSADGTTWTDIPKATKSTLALAAPVVVGDDVRVVVTSTMTGSVPATIQSTPATVLDKTVRLTAFPTITPAGGVKVGSAATAVGAAADVPGVTWTYQWADGGTPINGATAKTYKPASSRIGDLLTVTVVGHKTGYTDSDKATPAPAPATSAPEPVLDPAHDPLVPAAITLAAPKFGVEEQAPATTDVFDFPLGFTAYTTAYQWKLDGRSISHATAATYSPKTTDVGHKLSLTMSIKSDVYGSASQTSVAQKVLLGDAGSISANVIGNFTPGDLIGVALGYSGEGQLTYLWQVSSDDATTWAAIPKATKSTYLIPLLDAGKDIRVVVTSKVAGRANAVAYSDPQAIGYIDAIHSIIAPTVGSPQVGVAATVNTGTWNLTGLTFAYQWYLDDVAIPGATSATFTPIGSDATRDLSVHVFASRPGYLSGKVKSDSEEIAKGAAPVIATKPTITGTAATCKVLTVSTGSWNVHGLTVTYDWLSGGISTGDTGTTYTTVAGDAGKQISVRLTASGIGYAPGTYETAATKAVASSAGC